MNQGAVTHIQTYGASTHKQVYIYIYIEILYRPSDIETVATKNNEEETKEENKQCIWSTTHASFCT